jgi:hypothetical protein
MRLVDQLERNYSTYPTFCSDRDSIKVQRTADRAFMFPSPAKTGYSKKQRSANQKRRKILTVPVPGAFWG